MKKLLFIAIYLFSFNVNSAPLNFSFTGNLANDDDVQLFNFTVGTTSNVTLRTWSYAGGINADGVVIPDGGFDPILALFNSAGTLIDENDDGSPTEVSADPTTGEFYDSFLTTTLSPGDYTVSVAQFSNFAIGPTLSDGFAGSARVNFEGRTDFWAFDVLGVDQATVVPIPAAIWLFGAGLFGLIGVRKRVVN